ncbi:outer membrane beta-barrel protein [Mangrovibacterium lignilyticum]|uniref:outer membrane beta-barrel protein n=1 Tax=Mangrovibacterium lignilyticum TaxID=2668052 RepID=UPI0013D2D9AD|nr:outer membrane beta-barrel protein [Mangrovibacterium lignilyticum]
MIKEDKQIDELFRSNLEGFELKPPAYVWDGIVEKQAAAKRKKRVLWIRFTAVAASLLLAFLLGRELQNNNSSLKVNTTIAKQKEIPQNGNPESSPEKTLATEVNEQIKPIVDKDKQVVESATKTIEPLVSGANTTEVSTLNNVMALSESKLLVDMTSPGLSDDYSLLENHRAQLAVNGPGSGRLDNMKSNVLSELDRLIIEQNQSALLDKENKSSELDWSIGAMVSPVLAVNSSSHSDQYAQNMNASSNDRNVNLGGGLTVAVKTQRKWSFQSGINYSRVEQGSTNNLTSNSREVAFSFGDASNDAGPRYFTTATTDGEAVVVKSPAGKIVLDALPDNALVAGNVENTLASATPEVLMTTSDFDQVFDYIEVPFFVRYQLVDRKFGVQLMAGVNTGFLVGNSAYMTSGDSRSRVGKTSDMNSLSLSSSFGVGMGYQLTPNLQLRFEPQMRYYLESLSGNSEVSYKPHAFGFYTGISYSF